MSGGRLALGWRVAALIVLAALALPLFRITVAEAVVARSPAAALKWWPWHADARLRIAKAGMVTPEKPQTLERVAREMLLTSPLAGGGYAALAVVAEREGDDERAEVLYRIATVRSPRDRVSHAWLANRAGARREFALAVHHIDQMLRLSPETLPILAPTLESIAANPEGREGLITLLGEHAPPWRTGFINYLATSGADLGVAFAVYNGLKVARVPATPAETLGVLQRLIRQGFVAQAYVMWVSSLPPSHRQSVGNVFDGGFELPFDAGVFGWRMGRVPGAFIRAEPVAGMIGHRALVIDFQHRHVPFGHVQQSLALPAGSYKLSGRVRMDDLVTERGLRWSVSCVDGAGVVAETAPFSGRKPWREFAIDFTVPQEKCRSQELALTLGARIKREQWIGGRIWFDGVSIRRRAQPQ